MTEPEEISDRAADAIAELIDIDGRARGHIVDEDLTLAPLSSLLTRVADDLEQRVLSHVDGQPFAELCWAIELLRHIVRSREQRIRQLVAAVDAHDLTPYNGDEVPNYCQVPMCQNLATPAGLCLAHVLSPYGARR